MNINPRLMAINGHRTDPRLPVKTIVTRGDEICGSQIKVLHYMVDECIYS